VLKTLRAAPLATTPIGDSPTPPSRCCAGPPRSSPSSGKIRRHRLNRGGDRQANAALHRIVVARLRHDQQTKDYLARRIREGKFTKEAIRCFIG
jgi:hypothetical protein